jgi:hypothetical protein
VAGEGVAEEACAFDVGPGNFATRDKYSTGKIIIATGVAPLPAKCFK